MVLSKSFDHNEPFEYESDNETTEVEINLQLSMQEKLARAIDKEINSKIKFQVTNNKRCNEYCEKELAIFEVEGKRGANLESCYENLNSKLPKLHHLYMMRAWTC
jgi:hypothetical protein